MDEISLNNGKISLIEGGEEIESSFKIGEKDPKIARSSPRNSSYVWKHVNNSDDLRNFCNYCGISWSKYHLTYFLPNNCR
jgi:hypothetical protein